MWTYAITWTPRRANPTSMTTASRRTRSSGSWRGLVRTGRLRARQSIGQTSEGRFLRVIYVPDEDGDGVFVVTAYPLTGKPLKAYRRRQRRRKR